MTDDVGLLSSLLILLLGLSGVYSFTNGDLRLAGVGASPLTGRLEVYYNSQWGTVCGGWIGRGSISSLHFDMESAQVACRQMGLGFSVSFSSVLHQPQYRFQYGVANSSIVLTMVNCNDADTQNHLLQCARYSNLGVARGCDHSMDVVLQCSNISSPYNGEVRLVPAPSTPKASRTPSSGRLQLYSEGTWKHVCLEGVAKSTADVLCRQMGYTNARAAPTLSGEMLEEAWHMGGPPLNCSQSAACIGSCLSELPNSPSVSSCRATDLQCEFDSSLMWDASFGTRAACERPKRSIATKSVRLIYPPSSSDSTAGRLETYVGGAWGSVCLGAFTIQDAEVVCKQLGFPFALAVGRVGAQTHFSNIEPASTGTPIHSVGSCRGVELHLSECSSVQQQCSSSDHSNDVAVKCSWRTPYGAVALHSRANGSSGSSGTLVMYTGADDTQFYPVCDADFGPQQATVACRQLGYTDGIVLYNSYFGSYDDRVEKILRMTGSCTGSESQLLGCPPAPGWNAEAERRGFVLIGNLSSECRPGMDEVSLHCVSEEIQFRLVDQDGQSSDRGQLEINYGGTWGRICSSGFGISEAQVACRHIGYPSVLSVRVDANGASSSDGPVHLSNLSCSGFERSMLHCRFSLEATTSSCSAAEDTIWLMCGSEPHEEEGTLRLADSQEQGKGRLEISFNGHWHSLCGLGFSDMAAQVACRELGFANVTRYCTDACLGRGSNDVLLVKEMCNGSETSLRDCPRQDYHSTLCDHSFDIGLACADPFPPDPTEPTTRGIVPPQAKEPGPSERLFLYYVLGGVAGSVLMVVLTCLCCMCCCCWRRKKKALAGDDVAQNGHTHLSMVGDLSRMPPIKDEGFDDPKEALDEIELSPHPLALFDRSLTPPLPPRHHDVILHALSSSSQNSDEDQPAVSTGKNLHTHLNQAASSVSEFQRADGSKMGEDLPVVVAVGNGHRGGSPISFTSAPPPNYDEIFQSASPIVVSVPESSKYMNGGCHANKSTNWYEDTAADSDDSENGVKKR